VDRSLPSPASALGLKLLVDLSDLDTADLSDDGVENISAPMVERDWYYPPAAVTIIAPVPETLEAVRAYRAHLGGSKSKRHIFRTEEKRSRG
jgi:hypothetical protein